jgi:hypothetical protein
MNQKGHSIWSSPNWAKSNCKNSSQNTKATCPPFYITKTCLKILLTDEKMNQNYLMVITFQNKRKTDLLIVERTSHLTVTSGVLGNSD